MRKIYNTNKDPIISMEKWIFSKSKKIPNHNQNNVDSYWMNNSLIVLKLSNETYFVKIFYIFKVTSIGGT